MSTIFKTPGDVPIDVAPTVHLNGTSKKELMDGYMAAFEAVREARQIMQRKMTVHGRDYYVHQLGPKAWVLARDAHYSRIEKLIEIERSLEDIYIAIQEQG